ncbi:MAG: hypothetical protein ACJ8F7_06860 [Gemmataceae bacterium]
MTQVMLDAAKRSKLHNLMEPLELVDEQGRIVARVLPAYNKAEYVNPEPQISREELERRRQFIRRSE